MPKNPSGRKCIQRKTRPRPATPVEVIEVAPDIATLPDLSATIEDSTHEEDDDDNGNEEEEAPANISRASSSGEPIASTSSLASPRVPRRYPRPSHSDIPNYEFTEDQLQTLRDFIKQHQELYVKQHKSYSNPSVKNDLWHECATLFPCCDYLQCRKYFEQKRTAFGKIEKQEMKSGMPKRDRTEKEEKIMTEWGFLAGKIYHSGVTQSSHVFPVEEEASSDDDSAASGLSGHSIQRRRKKKKTRRPAEASGSSQDVPENPQLTSAIQRIVGQAESITNPRNREPWAGTSIASWTKFMGDIVWELPANLRHEAMLGSWTYVSNLKSNADAQMARQQQPVQATSMVTQHSQDASVPHQNPRTPATNVAPQQPLQQPAITAVPTVQYNPGAPPMVQASQFNSPRFFTQAGQHPLYSSGTTPTTIYPQHGTLLHSIPYPHNPATTHYEPNYMPPNQQANYGNAPGTSSAAPSYIAPSPAVPTTTSFASPLFSENLTELQIVRTQSSTLNTPQRPDRQEDH